VKLSAMTATDEVCACRRQQVRAVVIAVAFVILAMPGVVGTAWAKSPDVSQPAPDFALKNLAGSNLRLSEFRGDVVIVNFWSAACGRCREQLGELDAIHRQHRSNGMNILSINVDRNHEAARRMIADKGIEFPVLFDVDKAVSRLYDPSKLPLTVMVDPHGTVRYVHHGYKSGDEESYLLEVTELLAE